MSYCRADGKESDVYVIATGARISDRSPDQSHARRTVWWCCGCPREGCVADTRQEMIDHLLHHRKQGDKVPERALERLRREIDAG